MKPQDLDQELSQFNQEIEHGETKIDGAVGGLESRGSLNQYRTSTMREFSDYMKVRQDYRVIHPN